ncbi:DUF429 domain-containing protein [Halobiforma nitratireducens]|uniref:DUF429 domain-containing protein n=1 Tax=Halobiforma nitratireducens JCM 10879 TaxID=1227454 RepID=M0LP24_9EURY|nr:DUF429 domain-containing protein [Halobiforma nitratireducens]EMA35251.1 hypothetical protein C446_12999 [Halobiforma nitratireducens JCM 10879]
MSSYVGVDWASKGWLAVETDGQDWTATMHPSIHSVWFEHRDAASILVDIPIGLPSDRRRRCDREAKEFLGSARASSVFWTPCRAAVEADSYDRAAEANEERRGDGLSSQAWGIVPRIREVDRLLRDDPEATTVIRESHPEVCFAAFRGGDPPGSKQSETGKEERLRCLERVDDTVSGVFGEFVARHVDGVSPWARRIGKSNRDDLLDAMALALTAKLGGGEFDTFPTDPPTDDNGLPMEIVYVDP